MAGIFSRKGIERFVGTETPLGLLFMFFQGIAVPIFNFHQKIRRNASECPKTNRFYCDLVEWLFANCPGCGPMPMFMIWLPEKQRYYIERLSRKIVLNISLLDLKVYSDNLCWNQYLKKQHGD